MSRRRRPELRWQPQKERVGRRRSLVYQFLNQSGSARRRLLAIIRRRLSPRARCKAFTLMAASISVSAAAHSCVSMGNASLGLVPNPCASGGARRPAVPATRAAAAMQRSDRCRRRCGRRTLACHRTGSAVRAPGSAAAAWQASITKNRPRRGPRPSRGKKKHGVATVAHDRVTRRQFFVIGQRPWRLRSSSTRWTSTVGTEFTLCRAPPQERERICYPRTADAAARPSCLPARTDTSRDIRRSLREISPDRRDRRR